MIRCPSMRVNSDLSVTSNRFEEQLLYSIRAHIYVSIYSLLPIDKPSLRFLSLKVVDTCHQTSEKYPKYKTRYCTTHGFQAGQHATELRVMVKKPFEDGETGGPARQRGDQSPQIENRLGKGDPRSHRPTEPRTHVATARHWSSGDWQDRVTEPKLEDD